MADSGSAADMDWFVGQIVRVETESGQTIEGSVFAYDGESDLLVLQSVDNFPKRNMTIVVTSTLTNVESLGRVENAVDAAKHFSVMPVETADTDDRLESGVRRAETEAAKIGGSNVSATGQLVFNALAKTYACSWDGTTIEIMDGLIRLPEPYTADSLEGGDAASNARLRKVLDGELVKIAKSSNA